MPKIPQLAESTERLAINLFDIDYVSPELRARLLAGRLDLRRESIVRVNGDNIMETGVPFSCATHDDLLSAATACDLLRSENRREGDKTIRIYVSKGNGWTKVSGNTILTVPIDGELHLNPEVFQSARASLPDLAPVPRKVVF